MTTRRYGPLIGYVRSSHDTRHVQAITASAIGVRSHAGNVPAISMLHRRHQFAVILGPRQIARPMQ